MPRTLDDFDLQASTWHQQYTQIQQAKAPSTLVEWAAQVEHSVDATLRIQHEVDPQEPRGLPHRYKGRCKPPKLKHVTMTTLTVQGRPSDYQPTVEVHSHQTARMVRQCRRLESLSRLLAKEPLNPRQHATACQDWEAICRCRAFAPNFVHWCLEQMSIISIAMGYPTKDQVLQMLELAKDHTDAALQWDRQVWFRKLEFDRRLDQTKRGKSKAFQRLKQGVMDPLQHLEIPCEDTAIVHQQSGGTLLLYLGNPQQFSDQQQVLVNGTLAQIVASDEFSITCRPQVDNTDWPHECEVTQLIHTSDTRDIMAELESYWQRFWLVPDPGTADSDTFDQVVEIYHDSIIALTEEFVNMCGMKIDWQKSWAWATSSAHSKQLTRVLQARPQTQQVPCCTHATELGAHHTYAGVPKLGKLHDRIQSAIERLEQLQRMPHGLTVKLHLVRASVYAVAFYGAELVPLGTSHTDRIRQATCDAILGPSHSRNSHVAMLCMPKLLDPELFVIREAILAAQRFLNRATDDQRRQFLTLVCNHSGVSNRCRGPAGVLRHYLNRIDWQMDTEGFLHVTAFRKVQLQHLGSKQLTRFLEVAWSQDLLTLHSTRHAWKGHAPIHALETQRVLLQFDDAQQRALLNEISGAFQTNSQQSRWDPDKCDRCSYCEGVDTRFHRIHECAATADLRQQFASLMLTLEEEGLTYADLPVIVRAPTTEIFETFCDFLVEPCLDETLQTCLATSGLHMDPLRFYTDGSCTHPGIVDASHAALAVVVDLAPTPDMRAEMAQSWRPGQQVPTLHTLLAMRLPGRQTIHRAELLAVILICEAVPKADIVSDSQMTVALGNLCKLLRDPRLLLSHSEPDMALRMWRAVQRGTYNFVKIKAHQEIDGCNDLLLKYDRLGNQQADLAAAAACAGICPKLVAEADVIAANLRQQFGNLTDYFRYFLELQRHRAQLRKQTHQLDQHIPTDDPQTTPSVQLRSYMPTHLWNMPVPTVDHSRDFAWGPTWGRFFTNWLTTIHWPSDDAEETDLQTVGITWIELALSLMLFANMWLPIKRAGSDLKERLQVLTSHADVEGYNVRFSEFADTIQMMFKQMGSLRNTDIHPPLQRQLVRATYIQGFSIHSSGLSARPAVDNQAESELKRQAFEEHEDAPKKLPALGGRSGEPP
eukprot:Skav208600  [mRNA]  locus=scaffold598:192186:198849:+ [translate_table: standard]